MILGLFLHVSLLFPVCKRIDGDYLKVEFEILAILIVHSRNGMYIIQKVLEMWKVRTGFRSKNLSRNLLLIIVQ